MSGHDASARTARPAIRDRTSRTLLVALVVLVLLGFVVYPFGRIDPRLEVVGPAVAMPAMGALYLWHGLRGAGPAALAAYCAAAVLIPGSAEVASLSFGFPFGDFAYGEEMLVTLFGVPAIVLAAYAIVGYWCWRMAGMLVGSRFVAGARQVAAATALMVAWSVVADPVRSTVQARWTWPDGGAFLGVPLSNVFGWTVTAAAMFAAFAAIERRFPHVGAGLPRGLRLCPPLMYGALALEYLLHPLVPAPDRVVTAGGVAYSSDAIFAVSALVALVAMVPVAACAAAFAWRSGAAPAPLRPPRPFPRADWK